MIAMMLAAAAVTQAAAPPTPAEDDIVVIGERLKHLEVLMNKDRKTGTRRCAVRPSSGDSVLDAGVCTTHVACVPKADTAETLKACMTPALTTLVAEAKARGSFAR